MVPEVEKAYAHAKQIGIQGVPFVVLDLKFGISGAQEVEKYAEVSFESTLSASSSS